MWHLRFFMEFPPVWAPVRNNSNYCIHGILTDRLQFARKGREESSASTSSKQPAMKLEKSTHNTTHRRHRRRRSIVTSVHLHGQWMVIIAHAHICLFSLCLCHRWRSLIILLYFAARRDSNVSFGKHTYPAFERRRRRRRLRRERIYFPVVFRICSSRRVFRQRSTLKTQTKFSVDSISIYLLLLLLQAAHMPSTIYINSLRVWTSEHALTESSIYIFLLDSLDSTTKLALNARRMYKYRVSE